MRFFSFDGEIFDTHATEEQAREAAAAALADAQDRAGDGWPEWVGNICWGPITERVVLTREVGRDVPDREEQPLHVRSTLARFDIYQEYELLPVKP